jgi:thioredoxin 1
MPASDTHYVSDAEFKAAVLDAKEPVVVDFFAEWCGPCKAMAPALDQVATEMKGKVKIVKVDVDQSPATAQAYRIQAMPTMMMFKDGKVVDQHVGAMVPKPGSRNRSDHAFASSCVCVACRTLRQAMSFDGCCADASPMMLFR